MKIAILADIHANAEALEIVLKKAKQKNVTFFMIAGDLIGYYYQPSQVLSMIQSLNCLVIKGNHEDIFLNGKFKASEFKFKIGFEKAQKELTHKQILFLKSLQTKSIIKINNKRVLLCHGSPWDNSLYIYPDMDKRIRDKLNKVDAEIIITGNTHYPMYIELENKIIINPGSVGQPRDCIPGACWLFWDTIKDKFKFYRENYNFDNVIKMVEHYEPENKYLSKVLQRTKK